MNYVPLDFKFSVFKLTQNGWIEKKEGWYPPEGWIPPHFGDPPFRLIKAFQIENARQKVEEPVGFHYPEVTKC